MLSFTLENCCARPSGREASVAVRAVRRGRRRGSAGGHCAGMGRCKLAGVLSPRGGSSKSVCSGFAKRVLAVQSDDRDPVCSARRLPVHLQQSLHLSDRMLHRLGSGGVCCFPRLLSRCRQLDSRRRSLAQLIQQYSLGESRSLLHLSYATERLPEAPRDSREGVQGPREPQFNWKELERAEHRVSKTLRKDWAKEELQTSRSIVGKCGE